MTKIHWERLDDDGVIVCSGQDTVMSITELQFVKTSAQRFVVLAHGKEDIFCRRCMIRAGHSTSSRHWYAFLDTHPASSSVPSR